MRSELCGVLNLHKPTGLTSRAVVDRVSRPLRGTRVGHAGTRDPLATGVLVVCVGPATRLIEYVQRMSKTYRTVVRLGARSDTNDADGQVIVAEDASVPTELEIRAALTAQVGTIAQRPPEFSAIKVEGRRSYDLARSGKAVELAARPVTVYGIDVTAYAWPRLELEIECGSGTYIRSIARDLGEALGCGGLVEVLVRTRIGAFSIDDAIDPLSLTRESIPDHLLPAIEALGSMPRLKLSAEQVAAIAQGRAVEIDPLGGETVPGGEVALIGPDGTLAAIAGSVPQTGRLSPRRVFVAG